MNDYNQKWCDERHSKIDHEFKGVWTKLKSMDNRVWTILILLFMNLAGVLVLLAKT